MQTRNISTVSVDVLLYIIRMAISNSHEEAIIDVINNSNVKEYIAGIDQAESQILKDIESYLARLATQLNNTLPDIMTRIGILIDVAHIIIINLIMIDQIKNNIHQSLEKLIEDPHLRHMYLGFDAIYVVDGIVYRGEIQDDMLSINYYLTSIYDIARCKDFNGDRLDALMKTENQPSLIPSTSAYRRCPPTPSGSPYGFFSSDFHSLDRMQSEQLSRLVAP